MAKSTAKNLEGRQKGKNDLPKLKAKHIFYFQEIKIFTISEKELYLKYKVKINR